MNECTKHHSAMVLALLVLLAGLTACASGTDAKARKDDAHGQYTHKHALSKHKHGAHTHTKHHHGFKDPERLAKRWNTPERDAKQKPQEILGAMQLAPGQTIVDLGAGTGYLTTHIAKAQTGKGGKILALDIEPNMVAYLKKQQLANVEARQVKTDDPGLAAASVDRVVVLNTWHHIDGRVAYAKKLRAAMKPGGRVVIVEFIKDDKPGPPAHMRMEPAEVIRELKAGGFDAAVHPETIERSYIIIGTLPTTEQPAEKLAAE